MKCLRVLAGFIFSVFIPVICLFGQKPVPLKIGDKVPSDILDIVLRVNDNKKRVSDSSLPIILDFWAPWCTPCILAFENLDILKTRFNNRFLVIPISKEPKEFCDKVLSRLKVMRNVKVDPGIVGDTVLFKYFRHRVVPHYVWIDKKGIIRAVTGNQELDEANLDLFIRGESLELSQKNDYRFFVDYNKPLFWRDSGYAKKGPLLFSTLTGYNQYYRSISLRGKNWIRCTNHSIGLLFKVAFGRFNISMLNSNRLVLEGFDRTDSVMIGIYKKEDKLVWKEMEHEYLYNYELMFGDSVVPATEMFEIMQQDLNRYFRRMGYEGRRENRVMKSLELVRISREDRLKTGGGTSRDFHNELYIKLVNQPMALFVSYLQVVLGKELAFPIVNSTKYSERIDIEINNDGGNLFNLNTQLEKYGLSLREKNIGLDVVVIRKL